MPLKYKRVLLKLSGGALTGRRDAGLDAATVDFVAEEIKGVIEAGLELGVVVGGGNYFRGRQAADWNLDRVTVDYMGMVGTVINGLALADVLEKKGVPASILGAFAVGTILKPYDRQTASERITQDVVIFVGGTGHPFFTTDTAAALRAYEVGAGALLKATDVNGIYDKDPNEYGEAKVIRKMSYAQALEKDLPVLDPTAAALCMKNRLPLIVYNGNVPGNLMKAVKGEYVGTTVG